MIRRFEVREVNGKLQATETAPRLFDYAKQRADLERERVISLESVAAADKLSRDNKVGRSVIKGIEDGDKFTIEGVTRPDGEPYVMSFDTSADKISRGDK